MMMQNPGSRTAFVLAGGGSLGAVEVGMLAALAEHDVHADLVVGASAGAINGAFFAGRPDAGGVEGLAEIWRGLSRRDVFPVSLVRGLLGFMSIGNHIADSGRLRRLLDDNLAYKNLEDARMPIHVVATDLVTGLEVVFSSGIAVDAVLASASIPAIFPPVRLGGRYLADGGIANNTPISVARDLGATRAIVLPTGFACHIDAPPGDTIGMALHAMSLLIARQLVVDLERFADRIALHVVPPLCPLATSPMDFSQADELIERGAESTRRWLADGGLEQRVIPPQLQGHSHG